MTDHYVTDGKHLLSTTQRGIAALEAGIAEHRDEHHRLDREDNHITRDLGRGDADLVLWALLDAGQTDQGDQT